MTQPTNDPLEAAQNAQLRPAEFWGEVSLATWFAVLVKGTGKVAFDPQQHAIEKRVTAIDINIYCLPEQNFNKPITRGVIAESREWAGTILPSIKALGVTLKDLSGKFAHVVAVPTGGKYTNNAGEQKDQTTLKFVAVFNTEAECRAAYLAAGGKDRRGGAATSDVEQVTEAAPANGAVANPEKETAKAFLPALAKQAKGDVTRMGQLIAQMPLINKFFTVNSPEVQEAMVASLTG